MARNGQPLWLTEVQLSINPDLVPNPSNLTVLRLGEVPRLHGMFLTIPGIGGAVKVVVPSFFFCLAEETNHPGTGPAITARHPLGCNHYAGKAFLEPPRYALVNICRFAELIDWRSALLYSSFWYIERRNNGKENQKHFWLSLPVWPEQQVQLLVRVFRFQISQVLKKLLFNRDFFLAPDPHTGTRREVDATVRITEASSPSPGLKLNARRAQFSKQNTAWVFVLQVTSRVECEHLSKSPPPRERGNTTYRVPANHTNFQKGRRQAQGVYVHLQCPVARRRRTPSQHHGGAAQRRRQRRHYITTSRGRGESSKKSGRQAHIAHPCPVDVVHLLSTTEAPKTSTLYINVPRAGKKTAGKRPPAGMRRFEMKFAVACAVHADAGVPIITRSTRLTTQNSIFRRPANCLSSQLADTIAAPQIPNFGGSAIRQFGSVYRCLVAVNAPLLVTALRRPLVWRLLISRDHGFTHKMLLLSNLKGDLVRPQEPDQGVVRSVDYELFVGGLELEVASAEHKRPRLLRAHLDIGPFAVARQDPKHSDRHISWNLPIHAASRMGRDPPSQTERFPATENGTAAYALPQLNIATAGIPAVIRPLAAPEIRERRLWLRLATCGSKHPIFKQPTSKDVAFRLSLCAISFALVPVAADQRPPTALVDGEGDRTPYKISSSPVVSIYPESQNRWQNWTCKNAHVRQLFALFAFVVAGVPSKYSRCSGSAGREEYDSARPAVAEDQIIRSLSHLKHIYRATTHTWTGDQTGLASGHRLHRPLFSLEEVLVVGNGPIARAGIQFLVLQLLAKRIETRPVVLNVEFRGETQCLYRQRTKVALPEKAEEGAPPD
ncbi:hypothetical protein DFH06DRAFT_1119652 [Mycena polygramma]|nr:hypothetical protein DFH06DRAFT_1119648 [Mycena polygramma]KAJ7682394.1 hypothetical protein DFH06DRAFT_1119652 [Mycena polygramma]